ncbi:MAG TPA: EAL domain-containing protein, partial [Steroidobacteraceae bacterium]|nr:EAL domain-containing protein [Steroidobacteraceae bacterium]
ETKSLELGSTPERSTESVLRAVCLRLGCTAATAVFPREDSRAVWSRSEEDAAFARQQLSIVGDELARRAIETKKPVATNKLKHVSGGQIACKLVAVPLIARGGPAGALIIFNRPEEPSFDEFSVRRLGRFARLLARNATQDLDSLTGLLSWDGFKTRVDTWQRNAPPGAMVSMLYGDIDCLHLINDLAGFSDGDRVIARCGASIRHALVGADSFACRLSGDRFTVFLPHMNLAQTRQLADRICKDVSNAPAVKQEPNHPVSMSWGAVSTSACDLHLDHRIAEAEIACKTAKDRGRGRVEVYQDTDQSMIRRHDEIGLIGSVREALRLERIVVYAQPITPLINHSLPTTYELLVRIVDAKGNIVEAADFMSAATRYQILPEIDRAVCERAFEQLSKNTSRAGPLRVSINLSGPTLSDPEFLEWLLASMAKYGIDGTCLVFEITEAAAAANMQQVQQFIRRLSTHGVRFALDDFGTGVSSLAYLKDLEINTIKLDGSYVVDVLTNPRSQALVRAIVQLADAMGITTVAEYVESNTVRDRLASLGIQFGQGFALGRPGPLDDVLAAVADRAPEGRERPFTERKTYTTPSGIPIMFKHA